MTTIAKFLLLTSLAVITGPSHAEADEPDWSAVEQEIWAMEERYMTAFKDGDLAGLNAFLHADFLGWPSYSSDPVARAPALESVSALHESLVIRTVDVRPCAIHVSGKIALVHYLVVLETEEGDGGTAAISARITHTWIWEDGRWQILGGMSAGVEAAG